MGFDFIVIAPPRTVSLWLLRCLWMWGTFFGEFQCLPVDDCSAVSCDSGVLARGSECTFCYSAILNESLSTADANSFPPITGKLTDCITKSSCY